MGASLQPRKTSRGAIKPFAAAELIFSQHGHGEAEIRRIDSQCQHFSYDACKSRQRPRQNSGRRRSRREKVLTGDIEDS